MTAHSRARRLRPPRFDDLGLRRAVSDRLLPSLVAAMAFLAALAWAGFVAAEAFGMRWQTGAGSSLTVQVPQPGEAAAGGLNRRDAVVALVRGTPRILAVHALSEGELADLLRPWLGVQGETMTLPLPAVIEVRLAPGAGVDLDGLAAALERAAPGTLLEDQAAWMTRLSALADSLQASAGLALVVVAGVAAAVVAVATRAGLAARRQAIEIVHGLGATDGYIAGRFAGRTTWLVFWGAAAGAAAALPVLMVLAVLAAPFGGAMPRSVGWLAALPVSLWVVLPSLPTGAAAIGWLTAQATVRRWLRRLA